MSLPAQSSEHNDLMNLLMKAIDGSPTTHMVILITIGHDGCPCIAGNGSVKIITDILSIVASSTDKITGVTFHEVPETN